MTDPLDEIAQLRHALSILRNASLRMCCPIRDPDRQTVDEVIHIKRKDWNEAFKPLIVPPYNKLRWEQSE